MYQPIEAANKLGVGLDTLYEWSEVFALYLSENLRSALLADEGYEGRVYTDSDIALLRRARMYMAGGQPFERVKRRLVDEEDAEVIEIELVGLDLDGVRTRPSHSPHLNVPVKQVVPDDLPLQVEIEEE